MDARDLLPPVLLAASKLRHWTHSFRHVQALEILSRIQSSRSHAMQERKKEKSRLKGVPGANKVCNWLKNKKARKRYEVLIVQCYYFIRCEQAEGIGSCLFESAFKAGSQN